VPVEIKIHDFVAGCVCIIGPDNRVIKRGVYNLATRDLAVTACKILSLFTVVLALKSVNMPVTWPVAIMNDPARSVSVLLIITVFMPTLIFLILAGLFWFKAGNIAGRMVSSGGDGAVENRLFNFKEVQILAFSVVGVLVLADALPVLAVFSANLVMMLTSNPTFDLKKMIALNFIPQGAGLAVRLAIGIWLLLGAKGLCVFLKNIREAGLVKKNDD